MHEYIKTIYTFDVYSSKGVDTVKAKTTYKTINDLRNDLRNEIEQIFKKRYNIKGSLIVQLIDIKRIYN